MKRIIKACLEQTIKFEPKAEYESYKKDLARKNTRYLILEEKEDGEDAIIVKLKKQYNSYDCGDYMN